METETDRAVLDELRELTVFPERMRGRATEIYYDTRVSGDDLWDLISGLAKRFDVDFAGMKLHHYAPGEGAQLIRPLLMLFGGRPYRNLTVGQVAAAIQRGYWRDD